MLTMNWRIIQRKIRQVAKTMGKTESNLCKQALIAGQQTCNWEDLLTECINICKELNTLGVTKGKQDKLEQLKIKRALWRENDKEIREGLDKSDKVKHLPIPKFKK